MPRIGNSSGIILMAKANIENRCFAKKYCEYRDFIEVRELFLQLNFLFL